MNELTVCGAAAASSAIVNEPHDVSTVAVYDLVVSIASGGADGNVSSFGFAAFASRHPAFDRGARAARVVVAPAAHRDEDADRDDRDQDDGDDAGDAPHPVPPLHLQLVGTPRLAVLALAFALRLLCHGGAA